MIRLFETFLVFLLVISFTPAHAVEIVQVIELQEAVSGQKVIDAVERLVTQEIAEDNQQHKLKDASLVKREFNLENRTFWIIGRFSKWAERDVLVGVSEKYPQYYIDPATNYTSILVVHHVWKDEEEFSKGRWSEGENLVEIFKSVLTFRQKLENELKK